jgi:hypothetical protein
MFKWSCLGIAVLAAAALIWMVNDVRRDLKQSAAAVNEHLPAILEKTKASTDALHDSLPEIVDKAKTTTDTLAELSEDVRQLKELAGMTGQARDQGLVAYANAVMEVIERADGVVGVKKVFGKGLKDAVPAKEWAVGGRKKAVLLTIICRSRAEFLTRLCEKVLGTKWFIQIANAEPVPLADWVRARLPDGKEKS